MMATEDHECPAAPRREQPVAGGVDPTSIDAWFRHRLPDWPMVWSACVRRTHSWSIPPRWSLRDWWEEIDAESIAAALHAIQVFDPSCGPTLRSFVYHRILSRALARYRQEWAYALHCGVSSGAKSSALRSDDQEVATSDVKEWLICTLARLTEGDQRLIELLFWEGWTESEVAGKLGISQQAVSKRKRKALLELRKCLNGANQV